MKTRKLGDQEYKSYGDFEDLQVRKQSKDILVQSRIKQERGIDWTLFSTRQPHPVVRRRLD